MANMGISITFFCAWPVYTYILEAKDVGDRL